MMVQNISVLTEHDWGDQMKGNEMGMQHVWGDKNYNTQFSPEIWVKFLKIYHGQKDTKETYFKKYDGAGGWQTDRETPCMP